MSQAFGEDPHSASREDLSASGHVWKRRTSTVAFAIASLFSARKGAVIGVGVFLASMGAGAAQCTDYTISPPADRVWWQNKLLACENQTIWLNGLQNGVPTKFQISPTPKDTDQYCVVQISTQTLPNGGWTAFSNFRWLTWDLTQSETCYSEKNIYRGGMKNTAPPASPQKTCDCDAHASDPAYGYPIHPLSGSKTKRIDLGLSVGGQQLVMTYRSSRQLSANAANVATTSYGDPFAFGALWFSSLHRAIVINRTADSFNVARGDGTFSTFWLSGTTIQHEADNLDTLVQTASGFTFTDARAKTVETYSASGQLLSLSDAAGNTLTFTYGTAADALAPDGGYLESVTDQNGRSIQFAYMLPAGGNTWSDGLISKAIGPSGTVTFAYDANRNLTSVTWPDGKVHQFVYENASFPWALTGEVDENASRYGTYGYDANGRAVSTQLNGGVESYQSVGAQAGYTETTVTDSVNLIHYNYFDATPPTQAQIIGPNGVPFTLQPTMVNGVPYVGALSQSSGSGSAASSTATSFDASGNMLSHDDFDGTRTCYAYDTSNRETTRIEGLANTVTCSTVTPSGASLPAGARRIATTWHPDWRLPATVTQALRLTTNVYQGQPDPFNGGTAANCSAVANLANGKPAPLLCKTAVQSLLASGSVDTTVPAQVDSYTYDSAGRVLTHVDANSHTTTFAYYNSESFTNNGGDPNFASVALLLHADAPNGSSTVTDSSESTRTVASGGMAVTSTAQSEFGGGSLAFNGSSNYWTVGGTDLAAIPGDLTVETWAYLVGTPSTPQDIIGTNVSSGTNNGWVLRRMSDGSIVFGGSTNGSNSITATGPSIPSAGAWHHLAGVMHGGSLTVFIDGVPGTSASLGGTQYNTNGSVIIGRNNTNSSWYFNGYLDEIRITKGVARYTSGFAIPTAPFPNTGLIHSVADTGHEVGDLQTITNAAGQVTQFTSYEPAGRLREMVDAKGITTDITYTPRGFVNTVAITPPGGTARTTTYSYDGVGQVVGVSQPDGTTLSFTYDGAHRLTGATDARGNSVTYTLDNAGNRIGENVHDASGTLQRSIARSFDALNRLQQVTGAAQ